MSVYSEPLSSSFRAVDFSFCFDSPSFSDCIVVLTTRRHATPSMYQQLLGSAKQLALATVQLTADTVASVNDTAASRMADMSSWISSSTGLLSSWAQPAPTSSSSRALVATHTLHVNSAVLAAASPYFKQLLQQPVQPPCKLVAAAARASSRGRGSGWGSPSKRILALQLPEGRGAAAAAIIRYMFTATLQVKDVYEALDLLVVAEQLQVQEAAEECLHYLECRPLDWPLCLTLLHLQYQQQQQQQVANATGANSMVGSCPHQQHRQQQQWGRSLSSRWPLQSQPTQEPIEPPLPSPSSSSSLAGLLQRARQHLLSEFEDFEAVWATAEGRERFLVLPLPAVVTLLGDPALQVASENTVLLAVACWLQEHSGQATDASSSSSSSPSSSSAAAGTHPEVECAGSSQQQAALDQDPHLDQGVTGASHDGARHPAAAAAEQLLGLVHVAQLSYTYLLHVLPVLPALQGCGEVVQQVQREALWYKAAGRERQAYIAASAAASHALASSLEGATAAGGGIWQSAGSSTSVPTVEVQLADGALPAAAAAAGGALGSGSPSKWQPASPGPSSSAFSDAGSEAPAPQHPSPRRASRPRLAMQEQQAPPVTVYSLRPASMASGYQFKVQLALADLLAGGDTGSGGTGHDTSARTGEHPPTRLLGVGSHPSACCTLPDQWYAGFVWNLVVAADGFVGLMWHISTDARGGQRLAPGPVREAEVGIKFSLWAEQQQRTPAAAAWTRSGSSGSLAAAAGAGPGGGSPSKAPVSTRDQQLGEVHPLQEGRGAAAAAGGAVNEACRAAEAEQLQGQHGYGAGAFTTPQYVPAGCACGFSAFLGPGLELLRGAPGEVLTLLCRLQLCD